MNETKRPEPASKPIVYIDMDGTLVDFVSAFPKIDPAVLEAYADKDDIPGIFALMDPMPGAIDAVHALAPHYELYVLSTAPWKNPSAWSDKLEWIQRHFGAEEGTVFYKRVILSHHKHLNRGALLIDDRPQKSQGFVDNGGEIIHFGPEGSHPTWQHVVDHLLTGVR